MKDISEQLDQLVIANHILANEGVVDAFGHISARHPNDPKKFIMSRSRSPELVVRDDLMVFDQNGEPVDCQDRPVSVERFIHAGIYEARDDVIAVVHNHAHSVIPFTVTETPLRPIVHVAGSMGDAAPVWDIHDKFHDTDLLVTNMEQARDLAATLGNGIVALMRGHGCVVVGASIKEAVKTSIYVLVNAQLLFDSLCIGRPKYLTPGEIEILKKKSGSLLGLNRSWEYWSKRAEKR